MIYITGDTHGEFDRIIKFCNDHKTSYDDTMIVLGDVGLNYYCDERDQIRKDNLSKLPLKFFFIHGNHEARPYEVPTYKEEIQYAGTVYVEDRYPHFAFAKDGEVYNIDGKKAIVLGGAYSVDKFYRLAYGYRWFDSEQPTDEIKKYAEHNLDRYGWKIDIVLSHTCPYGHLPREMFLKEIDQALIDDSTEKWLDTIEQKLSYKRWYCGHYHIDKVDSKLRFVYDDILQLPIGSNDQ